MQPPSDIPNIQRFQPFFGGQIQWLVSVLTMHWLSVPVHVLMDTPEAFGSHGSGQSSQT